MAPNEQARERALKRFLNEKAAVIVNSANIAMQSFTTATKEQRGRITRNNAGPAMAPAAEIV
jgi:hypothetical protein